MPLTWRFATGPHSAVVLEPGADVIRLVHVVPDLVRLADRDLIRVLPVVSAVAADVDAAVDADDQMLRVRGIDPHRVEVGVNLIAQPGLEGPASVLGDGDARHHGVPVPWSAAM